jgi:hypothetical protein
VVWKFTGMEMKGTTGENHRQNQEKPVEFK